MREVGGTDVGGGRIGGTGRGTIPAYIDAIGTDRSKAEGPRTIPHCSRASHTRWQRCTKLSCSHTPGHRAVSQMSLGLMVREEGPRTCRQSMFSLCSYQPETKPIERRTEECSAERNFRHTAVNLPGPRDIDCPVTAGARNRVGTRLGLDTSRRWMPASGTQPCGI